MVCFFNKPTSFSPDSSQTQPPCSGEREILAIWTWAVWCQLASGPESSPWPILFACVMQSDSPSEKPGTVQFKGTPQSSVNDHQRHSDAVYGGTSSASTEVCDIPIFWSVPHHSALQHVFPCSFSQIWGDTPCLASPWSVCVGGRRGGGGGSQWGMGRDGKGAEWSLQCTKTLVHSSTLETCSPGWTITFTSKKQSTWCTDLSRISERGPGAC